MDLTCKARECPIPRRAAFTRRACLLRHSWLCLLPFACIQEWVKWWRQPFQNAACSRSDKNRSPEGQGNPHLLYQDNTGNMLAFKNNIRTKLWWLWVPFLTILLLLFACLFNLTYFFQPYSLHISRALCRHPMCLFIPLYLTCAQVLPPPGMTDYPISPRWYIFLKHI